MTRRSLFRIVLSCVVILFACIFHLIKFNPIRLQSVTFIGKDQIPHNGNSERSFESSPSVEKNQGAFHDHSGAKTSDNMSTTLPKSTNIGTTASRLNVTLQHLSHGFHLPRIVLGIFANPTTKFVGARHMMRTTYLSFDKVHQTWTPNRMCSIQKFSTKPASKWKPFECQVVYAFIAGGNSTRTVTNTPPSKWRGLLDSQPEIKGTLDSSMLIPAPWEMQKLMNRDFLDPKMSDWLALNVDEYYDSYKLWAWHQFIFHRWKGTFDYVAHMNWTVLIHPTEFWQNELFSPFKSDATPLSTVYAQVPNDNISEERFGLFSRGLHELLVEADPVTTYGALAVNRRSLDNLVDGLTMNTTITSLELEGIHPVGAARNAILEAWDKYVDALMTAETDNQDRTKIDMTKTTNNSTPQFVTLTSRNFSGPRILLGIFTMDSENEKRRRAAVRSTYLSYYNESATPHRICSLAELLKGSLPDSGADCQMAYAFVMGSNPQGPTELLEFNSTFPLTVVGRTSSVVAVEDEDDIVHLNIRENMEDGKSPTWFKYATTVLDNHIYFDYIAKTDTDTLIIPNSFLDRVLLKECPPYPRNIRVYGGMAVSANNPRLVKRVVGPVYFGGELYWMSPDLARFMSSPEWDRRSLTKVRIEDLAIGNFVHSYPGPIRRVSIKNGRGDVHLHPLKDVELYQQTWHRILMDQKKA